MNTIVTGIGRAKERPGILQRTVRAPIAPPFFLVGILAGFVGTTYLGVHVWLQLAGEMRLGPEFVSLRKAHAAAQLLLFFGAFVSGFLLQAMPNLVETPRLRPLWAIVLLPLFVAGTVLIFFAPFSPLGYRLIALHFIVITLLAIRFSLVAPRHALYRSGVPIAWATAWLATGALIDLSYPAAGLIVFWGAYMPLIEVSVRRVFSTLMGIAPERNHRSAATTASYLVAAIFGAVHAFYGGNIAWWLFSLFAFLTIATYVAGRFPRQRIAFTPPTVAFWSGMIWLLVGALLSFGGTTTADVVLHTWATGLALPLVLVVAPQVVRGHMGIQVFRVRLHLLLLALWQIVPLSRGPGRFFAWPGWVATATGGVTVLVLLVWSLMMIAALVRGWIRTSPRQATA
jgi:hypothetical protein